MPTIKISSTDEGSKTLSVVGDKIQHYTMVEEHLKDALDTNSDDGEEPLKCPFNRLSRRRRSYAGRSTSPTEFLFRREERAKLVSNCDIAVGTTSKPHVTSGRFDPQLARVLHEKLAEYAEDVNAKREERWRVIHNWEDTNDILQILEEEKPANNLKRSEILDFVQTTALTCARVVPRRRGSLASVREVSEKSMDNEISKFRRSRLQPSRRNVSPSSSIPENLTIDGVKSDQDESDGVFSGDESPEPRTHNVTPESIVSNANSRDCSRDRRGTLSLELNSISKENITACTRPATHNEEANYVEGMGIKNNSRPGEESDNHFLARTTISPSKCETLVRNLKPPTFKVMPTVNCRLDNHVELNSGISACADDWTSHTGGESCRVCKNNQSPQNRRKSRSSSLSPAVIPAAEQCECYPACCCEFSHFERKQISELMRSAKSTPNSRSHSPQPKHRRPSLDLIQPGVSTSAAAVTTSLEVPEKRSPTLTSTDAEIEKIRKRSRDMNGNRSRTSVPDRNNVITTATVTGATPDESHS